MTPRRLALPVLLALALIPVGLHARTLTAADGRTIEAEVLGFEGTEKVTIKRADTGQTFTLPISSFSASDQRALKAEEAAKKDSAIKDGDLTLELSRLRFDTRRSKKDVNLTDGSVYKGGLAITEEDWGYSITLKNNTVKPVENLRVEYILYTKVDEIKNTGRKPSRRSKAFSATFDTVPPGGRTSLKTDTVLTRETKLRGGMQWAGTGDNDTRDTLEGIWLRVYQGDKLVLESASPTTFMSTEKWMSPRK
jgi:hypothetical protein